jgi:CO/xanthine dehydrogenase Mo-binding subunit
MAKTTRRHFLQGSGGLLVYFALPAVSATSAACTPPQDAAPVGNAALDTWIRVEADGKVRIASGKVELGQGIRTALAQIAAEELDIEIERVLMATVDTAYSPDESYTFSSISIMQSGKAIRAASAKAKRILLGLAAQRLNVSAQLLTVKDGQFLNAGKPTGLDYWELLQGQDFNAAMPDDDARTKPWEQYRIVGQSVPRLDIPGKVFGAVAFLQDLRVPAMVHARVVRPPADRARLLSVDSAAATRMPGVLKVVRNGQFLAVVAERELQADRAAGQLRRSARWQLAEDLPAAAWLPRWLKSTQTELHPVSERSGTAAGEVVRTVSASYSRAYQAHASISPSAAVALRTDKDLTVWSHGQGMYPLRGAIARVVGLDESQVRCIHMEAAGCYGHNGADDAACDAAVIAMELPGRAVRLQWSRADEFAWEPYGPAMAIDIKAGLNSAGHIVDWHYDLWSCPHSTRPSGAEGAGTLIYAQHRENPLPIPPAKSLPQPAGGADRNAVPLYDFASTRVSKHLVTAMPLKVSALRALGAYANIFAIESFMDEMAADNAVDPFEYRIAQLSDPRAITVLNTLREISLWPQRPAGGAGNGWGVGFARFKNLTAYVGVVMQLHAEQATGAISLHKAFAVIDAGLIVNPDGVRAQIEGGIIQSASWTLKEQVRFSPAEILSRDWSSYPILKFDEIPDIHIEIITRPEQPPLGLGEAAQGPTAAAIANAVFHATGRRLRDIPLTLEETARADE